MTGNKKDKDNLIKAKKVMVQKPATGFEEKAITAVLENYAAKSMDLSGMSDDEKKEKEEKLYQAIKILTDSLGAKGLQEHLLSTQLLGIHDLQQKLLSYASRTMSYPEENQYYINAVTKLSNVFVSQVTLLQKLQGQSQQKVTVEHLHIHGGAQAIVGQVNANTGGSSEK